MRKVRWVSKESRQVSRFIKMTQAGGMGRGGGEAPGGPVASGPGPPLSSAGLRTAQELDEPRFKAGSKAPCVHLIS